MPIFDAGFKIAARVSGSGLTRLGKIAADKLELISETVQTTERLADRAFRARHGKERFVIYMEAYTEWAESTPWSVLAKSGLLSERERLPTRCLIFVLSRRGYHPQPSPFRLEASRLPT